MGLHLHYTALRYSLIQKSMEFYLHYRALRYRVLQISTGRYLHYRDFWYGMLRKVWDFTYTTGPYGKVYFRKVQYFT